MSVTHQVVEGRFLFAPDSGQLVALECYLDDAGDPCEVTFDDYREVAGRKVPHRLEVRVGESLFAIIRWTSIALAPANAKMPPPNSGDAKVSDPKPKVGKPAVGQPSETKPADAPASSAESRK